MMIRTFLHTARVGIACLGLALALGACQLAQGEVSPTALPETSTPPASTATLPPTSTRTPTATPLTPTATASITPSPTPDCKLNGGRMALDALPSDLLERPLEYRVYLPPCYEEQLDQHYPVVYLIHGQGFTDDQWDRMGADETADRLIAAGEMASFIIVMPRDVMWTSPEEDNFGDALVEDLLPHIDRTYRTLPRRDYRFIGGLSRGASWALRLGLLHWELFGALGLHSLPIFGADSPYLSRWLDAIPPESMPRILMDVGERDNITIIGSALWFEEMLTEKGIPHEWYLFTGTHDEEYWSSHMELYLRWYALNW